MKILHISNSDIGGGAARAAYRIHRCMLEAGEDSQMLVVNKQTIDKEVNFLYASCNQVKQLIPIYIEKIKCRMKLGGFHPSSQFSGNFYSNKKIIESIQRLRPDVVHLHWISNMGISIKVIRSIKKLGYPVVWTLHDEWVTTGGAHYLDDELERDLQHPSYEKLYNRLKLEKLRAWEEVEPQWVCPSHWLAGQLKKSDVSYSGIKVEVIPYPINLNLFKPLDTSFARQILGLKTGVKYIAFGAIAAVNDKRKGFKFLHEAIQSIAGELSQSKVEVVVFGSNKPELAPDLGMPVTYIGMLKDEYSLSLLYNAVNMFIAPSLQDNLPNTVIESLSCGTPVVAFDIGGMPDMITHKETGYLAKPEDTQDLAQGMLEVLGSDTELMEQRCRQSAQEKFSPKSVHQNYMGIYNSIQ